LDFFNPGEVLKLPPRLSRLDRLAYNLWWSWHPEGRQLFSAIDPDLWEYVYHNPVTIPAPRRSQCAGARSQR